MINYSLPFTPKAPSRPSAQVSYIQRNGVPRSLLALSGPHSRGGYTFECPLPPFLSLSQCHCAERMAFVTRLAFSGSADWFRLDGGPGGNLDAQARSRPARSISPGDGGYQSRRYWPGPRDSEFTTSSEVLRAMAAAFPGVKAGQWNSRTAQTFSPLHFHFVGGIRRIPCQFTASITWGAAPPGENRSLIARERDLMSRESWSP